MKPTITYEEVLASSKKKTIGFVDVRSPKEYQLSTIPGAVNIPVMDDEAREVIGKMYKAGQIDDAKQYGVTWASARLPEMYAQYRQLLNEYDELALFCSRGGMRSDTIFSLLKALGLPVSRIKGGYKAYRHYVLEHLAEQVTRVQFVTLYGLSGSGKTDILAELSKLGANVLDLEACANHRGSLLGSIGLTAPHSQKMFESMLFDASRNWQTGDVVFTEGESRRIGQAVMPQPLYEQIQNGQKIFIDAALPYRVNQIYHDYVEATDVTELINTLSYMGKVMNQDRVAKMQQQLKDGEAKSVIETLLVSYYDPKYSYRKKTYAKTFTNQNAQETAAAILAWQQSAVRL